MGNVSDLALFAPSGSLLFSVAPSSTPGAVLLVRLFSLATPEMGFRDSAFILSSFFFLFNVYLSLKEREREREEERQKERESQNRKQAPGSELSAQSPTRGSNS